MQTCQCLFNQMIYVCALVAAKRLRTIANSLYLVTQLVDTNEQRKTLVDKRCYIRHLELGLLAHFKNIIVYMRIAWQ